MADLLTTAELESKGAIDSLLSVLRDLDCLLEQAIANCQSRSQSVAGLEQFRGLYITAQETERLLHRQPGTPEFLTGPTPLGNPPENSPLDRLGMAFSLSAFDVAIIVIALAPEIDLRYERLYAFLQDDVTRKRPSVDLALSLLCCSAEERIVRRRHFRPDAPLVRHGIIQVFPDPSSLCPPAIAHCLKLKERIVRFLLGETGPDLALRGLCELVPLPEAPSIVDSFALCNPSVIFESAGPVVIGLRDASRSRMRQTAAATAAAHGFILLAADLSRNDATASDLRQRTELLLREAKLQRALPYFEGVEQVDQDVLFRSIAGAGSIVFLSTTNTQQSLSRDGCPVITVDLAPLSLRERRDCWESSLERSSAQASGSTLDLLASRFRLTPEQIACAVEESCVRVRFRHRAPESVNGQQQGHKYLPCQELMAAARAQSTCKLPGSMRRIQPKYSWNDLVVPPAVSSQLREFCSRIAQTERVLGEWGFEKKLSQGKGTTAIFTGVSGTGKTMAAEVVAGELQLELCKIDVAGVISKYIGETEQNLECIFTAAEGANAILFFDEADALFGKRSEVRDSHDRYANIEISYLLQKMEAYEGATILATNLSQNLDEAFLRRFAFTIRFPFPNEDERLTIWKSIWPQETPLATSVDFNFLARRFKLSGGNIKNVALAAAFLAAEEGEPVSTMHLLRAIDREYQKMGKTISVEELAQECREEKA
jgi:hypothetical protein